ncbi:MAG: efflux RND transporter periplasmic adaptor subunit [Gammaproteobacteria bacterium]
MSDPRSRCLLLGVLMLLAGCGAPTPSEPAVDESDLPLVGVIEARLAAPPAQVSASGLIAYKQETTLAFEAAGVIERLGVDVGDEVSAGALIGRLRRTSVGANPGEAALARELANRHLARVQRLHEAGHASAAELEDATLAVERSDESILLLAPAAGVILTRVAEVAQRTAAGEPVYVLGEHAAGLIARVALGAEAISGVAVGAEVTITGAGGAVVGGRVTRLSPRADAATGQFLIEIELDAPDATRAGLPRAGEVVRADIAARVAQSTEVVIPARALLDARADQGIVFVVDDEGIARRRAVALTGLVGDAVHIRAGLAVPERVVVSGVAYVRDGGRVRVRPTAE